MCSVLLLFLLFIPVYYTQTPVEGEFIVQFPTYMTTNSQLAILEGILGPSPEWNVIERQNAASAFPSDFALLKVFSLGVLSKLRSSPRIKSVFPQRRFTISPMQQEEEVENIPLNKNDITEEEEIEKFWWEIDDLVGRGDKGETTRRELHMSNVTGRISSMWSDDVENGLPYFGKNSFQTSRRLQGQEGAEGIAEIAKAQQLWEKGYTGEGVKVAVFDTGLDVNHPHFKNIISVTDWTNEGDASDSLGHGTFVTGVIASSAECHGFAPDAQIYSYRVFTSQKVSYTTWFLDAFNHAIHVGINILNLSIGGPDFNDQPFVEKVQELSANKVIIISAIGNDGPLYGTLNNPADQLDVIGVGGLDFKNQIPNFSSRGMTTWELPFGYGRTKPDMVAFGQSVVGSARGGGCRALSGTSVSSPVVAGMAALLASTVPQAVRWEVLNPASMKQILMDGAENIPGYNIFEQGQGKADLLRSYEALYRYKPHVSFSPKHLDLTSASCPYMWPYCDQPLYYSGLPVTVNVTVINGLGVTGMFLEPPLWIAEGEQDIVQISFSYSELLYPWTGYLAVTLTVSPTARRWRGTVEGVVRLTITSPPGKGEGGFRTQTRDLPLKVQVIPTPPRAKRILWDQFHSLGYPSGYFPRDVVRGGEGGGGGGAQQPFDWNGDHPHTNFRALYTYLRGLGFFIEILGEPYSCFNASHYGTLLIVDPEEEFHVSEINKLHSDIENEGLSVVVMADWYDVNVMEQIKFFDDNTQRWWMPVTGGANVPALNSLLKKYKMGFGDNIYSGIIKLGSSGGYYGSGTLIASFPAKGILIPFELLDESVDIIAGVKEYHKVPVIGLYQTVNGDNADNRGNSSNGGAGDPGNNDNNENKDGMLPGRIALFGDSSCLDSATGRSPSCLWLLRDLLFYTSQNGLSEEFQQYQALTSDYVSRRAKHPERYPGNKLHHFSRVLGGSISCKAHDFQTAVADNGLGPEPDKNINTSYGIFFEEELVRPKAKGPMVSSLTIPFVLLVFSLVLLFVATRHYTKTTGAQWMTV